MIKVLDLKKSYGSFEAVKGVSFEIGKGEIVGLLGPNGAGKTTIMKALTCFHFPSSGDAILNGNSVIDNSLEVKKSIGYLPETAPVYTDLNVYEYLDFIASSRNLKGEDKIKSIENVIKKCGLEKHKYKDINTLSKGYRQRVALAQAIIHEPEILILDEPTTGLDPNQIIEIRELIKSIGKEKTVILSTHILQEVEAVCDRVMIMNEGLIVAEGTTKEIGDELKSGATMSVSFLNMEYKIIEENLENFKFITSLGLNNLDKLENILNVKFSVTDEIKAAEEIFDFAVSNKAKLVELKVENFGLEDIFIRLTGEGKNEK